MKTFVVNLLGGSGLGKSTTAALVYGELKDRGQITELVREFVKEWAWSGKKVGPFGQSIIYGQQLERESTLYNKVEFIVTDSPLLLCPVYQKHYNGHESIKHCVFKDLAIAETLDVVHVNFLLKRNKPFDARGRYEDEKTAKLIDRKVEAFLTYHGIEHISVDVEDQHRVKFITDSVIKLARGE
jgi:nicotinamide riboside kinase